MDITTPPGIVSEILTSFFAALLGAVQEGLRYLLGLFVVRITLTDSMRFIMANYCWRYLKRRGQPSFRVYRAALQFIRPYDRLGQVGSETLGPHALVFWDGWRPLWVSTVQASDSAPDAGDIQLSFLRGTFNADKLVQAAIDLANHSENPHPKSTAGIGRKKRYHVQRYGGFDPDDEMNRPMHRRDRNNGLLFSADRLLKWNLDDLGTSVPSTPAIDRLALSPEIMSAVEQLRRWRRSEKWHKERHIPWRLGWLLYGPPGTGKSSLVSAVAQELDMPIHLLDLTTMDNNDFLSAWQAILNDTPAIMLIEDFHTVFNKKHPVSSRIRISFDCVLNAISGVEKSDGVVVIITTNNLDCIDEALGLPDETQVKPEDGCMSSRPGRLDKVLEFGCPDVTGRRRIAERILSSCPELIDSVVQAGEGDTGAQFQYRAAYVALRVFWEKGV